MREASLLAPQWPLVSLDSLKSPDVGFSTHRLSKEESRLRAQILRHGWQADDQNLGKSPEDQLSRTFDVFSAAVSSDWSRIRFRHAKRSSPGPPARSADLIPRALPCGRWERASRNESYALQRLRFAIYHRLSVQSASFTSHFHMEQVAL